MKEKRVLRCITPEVTGQLPKVRRLSRMQSRRVGEETEQARSIALLFYVRYEE